MPKIDEPAINRNAVDFCDEFLNTRSRPRYIFGRNEYAQSIANFIDVDGFIDDFTIDKEYLGKPVCKTEEVSADALAVVAVVLGRPLTAGRRLEQAGIAHLDYFSFYKHSGLDILPVTFWEDFKPDFEANKVKYDGVFDLLSDNESKSAFNKLINFRLTGDLEYMQGFSDKQDQQYFEDFLNLSQHGEVFVDVGGFDGYTTAEFIKRCPGYSSVHFFEPEESNMLVAREKLRSYHSVNFYLLGLSDRKETLRFSTEGSASSICESGDIEIDVDRLDDVVNEPISFMKMDVEGAEGAALTGAKQTITDSHPRLAISVYHKADDLWKIPEQIISYRDDYSIYLRHYTEGVTETVMFFIPKR